MFKMRCHVCGSTHTKRNGVRKGVQLYKCQECGYQFRSGTDVSEQDLWNAYQQEKQTIKELSVRYGMSVATIKRRLHDIKREWKQPMLSGEGYVHLDVTYWGRSFGVLLALDSQTGKPLYMAFVKSETVKDYEDAVSSIKERGYTIRGLIIDGKQALFKTFSAALGFGVGPRHVTLAVRRGQFYSIMYIAHAYGCVEFLACHGHLLVGAIGNFRGSGTLRIERCYIVRTQGSVEHLEIVYQCVGHISVAAEGRTPEPALSDGCSYVGRPKADGR